jgi:hypothetical protein
MWVTQPKAARRLGAGAALLMGIGAAVAGTDAPGTPPPGQPAVWTPKELNFVYQGFTAHYSCEGLREKVRQALLILGARADLTVSPYGCTSQEGRPDPFPGVHIKMSVLTPAPAGTAAPAGANQPAAAVGADWKKIDLRLDTDPVAQAGDCELIEQIKRNILPQFTARNVDFSSSCVPHQLSPGGTWLRAEVLVAAQKDDKALASK